MPRIVITVTGQDKVIADLSRRSGPQLNATLKKATKAAATAAKPFIVAAAPRRTGATARSVTVRSSRGGTWNFTAHQIGATVGPRIWRRHFEIVGTKRGIARNPWVARGAAAGSAAARSTLQAVVKADIQR